ncbi:MAG: sigma-54-dependent Fis family transcriptional regulator [Desulfobacterales bacterium]|nr:sigma-54-dependent Fis family transcriptional regulator [Desulfobacterales bacterium]
MDGRILIVDDEKDMLVLLKRIIEEKTSHIVETEYDPLKAVELLRKQQFDIIITDLKMPKMDGIAILDMVQNIQASAVVVIMTAYATIETAVEATRKGVFDYISKPFRKERILITINKAMEWLKLKQENIILRNSLRQKKAFPPIIGSSPPIMSIIKMIDQVARSTATIFISGESGTGKELAARAVHYHSDRKNKPFITVNCTAMPEQIIESELFGHVKGSFTGAWKNKRGIIEEADSGTLFLDEIGDLNIAMQAKLLRLLQEGEYKPVGGLTTKQADIRFVVATNQDLKKLIEVKQFREDLYYRLNVINLHLPSLRDRKEDIPVLAHHFLKKFNSLNNKKISTINPEAISALMYKSWPGNIRELENCIERGVIFCQSDTIKIPDILPQESVAHTSPFFDHNIYTLPFKEAKEIITKAFHNKYINWILQQNHGNISRAAEQAELQRQYLHRLIKEENINTEIFKSF